MSPLVTFLLICLALVVLCALFACCYACSNNTNREIQNHEYISETEGLQSVVVVHPEQVPVPVPDYDIDGNKENYERLKSENLKEIRQLQGILKESPQNPECSILIGVDATPGITGGYCVNLDKGTCEMYTFKTQELPWEILDRKNPAEFEMKNFLFALMLWENEIKNASGKIQAYTDNFAIKKRTDPFGSKVSELLEHYVICENVQLGNPNSMHINKKRDADSLIAFAKYIQPADDLSRWSVSMARDFISSIYGVHQFICSHEQEVRGKSARSRASRAWYTPTTHHGIFLRKVNTTLARWRQSPCRTCGFTVEEDF